MSTFTDETMLIIDAIKEFKKNNPDSDAVEKYYLTHGTFKGIVEYLKSMNDFPRNKNNIAFK